MIIKPKELIINLRKNQTAGHRAISLILFLTFWAGLLYLLRPLLVIAGWAVGYLVFHSAVQGLELKDVVWPMITEYVPMIVALSVTLISWALYNRKRFSGTHDHRRAPTAPLTVAEIASATRLGPDKVREMRAAPLMICYFDEERGEMVDAKCCFDLRQADSFLPPRFPADRPGQTDPDRG